MAGEKPKSRLRKILGIILNILMYLFFAVCVLALVFSIAVKKNPDGGVTLGGMQFRVVLSPSMEKCDETDVSEYEIKDIPVRSLVFIETVPADKEEADEWYAGLKVGDVLTFRYVYVTQETITHRITEITPKDEGGYIIELEGDNKASDADTLSQTIDTSLENDPNYIIGKVTGQSRVLGGALTILQNPIGIVCVVIIPCAIIAIFDIVRIITALSEGKRRREREAQEQKDAKRDAELEEMRRQLEELKAQQAAHSDTDTAPQEEKEQPTPEEIIRESEDNNPQDEKDVQAETVQSTEE